ncbi:MAG: CRISPR-associated protein [bacterium]
MLINLSNHPSDRWSEEQKRAAQVYGEIVDLDFPEIDPDASLNEVEGAVERYVARCMTLLEKSQQKENAVHIMGEMTFVYQFVKRMSARGVTCLAATTERLVEERKPGEKYARFRFVQFRPYE